MPTLLIVVRISSVPRLTLFTNLLQVLSLPTPNLAAVLPTVTTRLGARMLTLLGMAPTLLEPSVALATVSPRRQT